MFAEVLVSQMLDKEIEWFSSHLKSHHRSDACIWSMSLEQQMGEAVKTFNVRFNQTQNVRKFSQILPFNLSQMRITTYVAWL